MNGYVTIPAALQLILDDVGWFIGENGKGRRNDPSRTGLPRRHVLADYVMLEELGRRIGQKIHGMFVIGEWDRWGLLANVPHSNRLGSAWTGSPVLNIPEAEEIRDYVNSASHLELGLHGLLHDVWTDGTDPGGAEFFPPKDFIPGAPQQMAPPAYIRAHFDTFFELYNRWGFKGEIRSFVSPCGESGWHLKNELQPILKEYGIRYWANHTYLPNPAGSTVHSGVIFSRKEIPLAHWAAYDIDPDRLPVYDPAKAGIIGGHWPNLLRWDPENNPERLDRWAAWFFRLSEVFGMMLSKDIGFAHHQQLYRNTALLTETGSDVVIDLSAADASAPADMYEPVYVSVKKQKSVTGCIGGSLALYEEKRDFFTYKVDRTPGVAALRLTLADNRSYPA